jgi:hypothetical protein
MVIGTIREMAKGNFETGDAGTKHELRTDCGVVDNLACDV